jgi:hypothetical protein
MPQAALESCNAGCWNTATSGSIIHGDISCPGLVVFFISGSWLFLFIWGALVVSFYFGILLKDGPGNGWKTFFFVFAAAPYSGAVFLAPGKTRDLSGK